ncbi:MAG: hypothetical protein ABSD38_35115 [Syntrophorhabdales bacterium]|jgi:hypothetical protein
MGSPEQEAAMCLAQFFGNLSPFQIIVSAVALLTGAYTFYKSFLERAKISMYPGDAVRIVKPANQNDLYFHLMCNLVNGSTKVGTVHRLEVEVTGPQKTFCAFTWYQFYKYQEGAQSVGKDSDIYPVSVPKMDSKLLLVAFHADSKPGFEWREGEYEFKVLGWVNKEDRQEVSNLKSSVFRIQITPGKLKELSSAAVNSFVTVPVVEWERQHR